MDSGSESRFTSKRSGSGTLFFLPITKLFRFSNLSTVWAGSVLDWLKTNSVGLCVLARIAAVGARLVAQGAQELVRINLKQEMKKHKNTTS